MKNYRKFNLIFFITLASIIAMVAIANLVIDKLSDKSDSIVKPDKQLGWVFTGQRNQNQFGLGNFTISFNSWGLRENEDNLASPVRMILLGNSVTMAQHVPQNKTFAARLGAINAGFDGYDTFQERDRFNRDLYQLKPVMLGLVVVGIDIMSEAQSKEKIKDTMTTNRDFGNHHIMDIKPIYDYLFKPQEDCEAKDKYYLSTVSTPVERSIWREWTDTVLQIRSSSPGTKFFIVLSPPRSQVSAYRNGEHKFWLNENLQVFCKKNDIPFIDLLPSVAKMDPRQTYRDFAHYNELGHRIVAGEIEGQLRQLKIKPSDGG